MEISALPCFDDNYIWLLQRGRDVVAVDPGEAAPLLDYLAQEKLNLVAILITHRHRDHIGGLPALAASCSAPVYGPAGIEGITRQLNDAECIDLLDGQFTVIATPGHTREHLCYYGEGRLFCGDTLFAGGCGRVIDDTPEILYDSLQKLAALPPDTQVCCAHEYTLANLAFAAVVEPGNTALQRRITAEAAKRAAGESTLPSTLALELQTNPFLRCTEAEVIRSVQLPPAQAASAVFSALRTWKNHFK